MQYRADIDGLRSVAVLSVVLYHAGVSGLSGGFVGVDVFFVISGFLITTIITREITEGRFSLTSFYERRARRILPALIVVVVSCFVLGWFVLLPDALQHLGESAIAAALFVSNVYFTLNLNYFGLDVETAPLLHTWSLAVEEQFYLLFPLLLMFLSWRRFWHPIWIIGGLSLASLVAAVIVLPLAPDWVFYMILFRFWELGAGTLLALASVPTPRSRVVREVLSIVAIGAILLPVFMYTTTTPFPGFAALPPVAGATLLIWIGSQGGGSFVNGFLSQRGFVWVGLISYSLYLWHWPILAFLRTVLGTVNLSLPATLAAITLSFAFAGLSFWFVERPFRKRPPEGISTSYVFLGSFVSLAVVAVVGSTLYLSGGIPSRMPAEVSKVISFKSDRNPRRKECFDHVPKQGFCTIGAVSDKDAPVDFLFWGDSHADAAMPGMELAAERLGLKGVFAGRGGCAPIRSIKRSPKCAAMNESVWSWLQAQPDIPVVILTARWAFWVEGTRYKGEPGRDAHLEWGGAPEAGPEMSGNAAMVEAGLNVTVSEILATGRKVVLLGPVPEIGQDVPKVTARKVFLEWAPGVSLTRQESEDRIGRAEQILSRVAEANEDVWFVPVSDLFCDAKSCRLVDDEGNPLYIDDDHITRTTAVKLLSPRLEDVLSAPRW